MKRRRLLFVSFVLLGAWAIVTILIMCPNLFQTDDINYPYNDQVNVLESKINTLVKSNSILYHEVKAHVNRVRSNQVVETIQLSYGGKGERYDNQQDGKFSRSGANITGNIPNKNYSSMVVKLQDLIERLVMMPKTLEDGRPVIAVLVISCDRVTVRRCLDRLVRFRPSKEQFPIVVSQDCGHKATKNTILSFGDDVFLIQQPDLSDIQVPPKEKKFKGYFKIARHYGWALNQTFFSLGFKAAIIVEDDLDVSEDFYEYFLGTYPLLRDDDSLWCVSAWNDNGKTGLIDKAQPNLLYRTDFFPGLGWMLTDTLWAELSVKWPKSYWDDWIRKPEQRKNRACIRPEIPRTKTFGKVGVSNGLFFEKHLKYIQLNEKFVSFTQLNLTYLLKENYDAILTNEVYHSDLVTFPKLRYLGSEDKNNVRITYATKEDFKKYAKLLGLMDDFRSGVARTAYRGVVHLFKDGRRIFLAPSQPWPGYNITWS